MATPTLLPILLPLSLSLPLATTQEAPPDELAIIRAHYIAVEENLRACDVQELAPSVRAERARLLDELANYRIAGVFTTHEVEGRLRAPVFVDPAGNHCAVANLLRFTGEIELVERVRTTDNHAWVIDLADDVEFHAWLEGVGLTFEEAARIQYEGSFPGPGPDTVPPTGSLARPGGDQDGLGSTAPWGPAGDGKTPLSPGSLGGSWIPGGATPGGNGGVGSRGRTPGSPLGAAADWTVWWEYNKLEWLRPRPLDESSAGLGDDPITSSGARLGRARAKATEFFAADLAHASAAVRERAVLGHARVTGPTALPKVRAMLADPSLQVRLASVLSLGALGSEEGVHAALELTRHEGADTIGPGARPFAVAALALARAEGRGTGVERMLPLLVRGDVDAEYALVVHHVLAPSTHLEGAIRGLSGIFEAREPSASPLTARAIEALRHDHGPGVVTELFDELGDDVVAHRRAASLALGGLDGARERLMTASEAEREPLARAFALLSLGEQGGPDAREFLIRELKKGSKGTRGFAALALGRLAGEANDDDARLALREANRSDAKQERRGAYLLSLGFARDRSPEALDMLIAALDAPNGNTRGYAALALGLVGDARGRDALLDAFAAETDPAGLGRIAMGIALFGEERDARTLAAAISNASNPISQGEIALALGFHGTFAAALELLALLDRDNLSDVTRAATIDALGLLLSRHQNLHVARASSGTDFTQLPWWMFELLRYPI